MNNQNTSIIRAILCAAALIVIILSWLEVIPNIIGITSASIILCGVSIWNGIDSLQSGHKGAGIFKLIMAGVLAVLCIIAVIL